MRSAGPNQARARSGFALFCGAKVPQGGQSCPLCKMFAEDFDNPEAVASAKLRQGATV